MFGLGIPELILILIAILIIFGPKKLPEIGKAVGSSIKEFKHSMNEVQFSSKNEELKSSDKETNENIKES